MVHDPCCVFYPSCVIRRSIRPSSSTVTLNISAVLRPFRFKSSGPAGPSGAQMAVAEASAKVGSFEPCDSVTTRFRGVSGRALQDQIFNDYVVGRNVHLDYYSQKRSGKRLLFRHAVNQRVQQAVVDTYAANILKNGVVEGVRGGCWAIQDENDAKVHHLLSWGTLTEAMYQAAACEPENEQVCLSLDAGISGCLIFHPRTPQDVLQHLVDHHNEFHSGSSTHFIQRYQHVKEAEQAWALHASSASITVRSCPTTGEGRYEALYMKYVQEKFPSLAGSWRSFVAMKTFIHTMEELDALADYYTMAGKDVDFLDPGLPAATEHIIAINAAVAQLFKKHYGHTMNAVMMKQALLTTLFFAVPVVSRRQSKADMSSELLAGIAPDTPWLLKGPDAKDKINALTAPMPPMDSADLDADEEPPVKKARGSPSPGKAAKARGKAKPKNKATGTAETTGNNEVAGKENVLFLTRVSQFLTACSKRYLKDHIRKQDIAVAWRMMIQFALTGELHVTVTGCQIKQVKKYSTVESLVEAFLRRVAQSVGTVGADTDHMCKQLLAALDDVPSKTKNISMSEFFTSAGDKMKEFMKVNNAMKPVALHPAYKELLEGFFNNSDLSDQPALDTDVAKLFQRVHGSMPPELHQWLEAVTTLAVQPDPQIRDESNGVFSSAAAVNGFLRVRAKYTIEFLKTILCGEARLSKTDYISAINILGQTDVMDLVTALDLQVGETWQNVWSWT